MTTNNQNSNEESLDSSVLLSKLDYEPWTTLDIIAKLSEATEILLYQKNYDGHGWEEIQHANDLAKKHLLR